MERHEQILIKIADTLDLCDLESKENRSREISLVITKLEEAMMWGQRDMNLKSPVENTDNN